MKKLFLLNLFACGLSSFVSLASIYAAEPYLPSEDNEVLEILPRALLAERNELNSLRKQLAAEPKNARLAKTVAARYLQIGNQEGDPRFYGYARAAIRPWWEADNPPARNS